MMRMEYALPILKFCQALKKREALSIISTKQGRLMQQELALFCRNSGLASIFFNALQISMMGRAHSIFIIQRQNQIHIFEILS